MQPIKPCNHYTGRPAGTEMVRLQDGRSVFKLYFVDIPGRATPERFEWDRCGRPRAAVAAGLAGAGVEGVGFVTAFPHITKVFRFGPNPETVLHVRAYRTEDLEPLSLEREEGYVEFACLAEALIAAAEFRFWAEASTVEEYLQRWCEWPESPIANHAKLRR
ncbi:MAG: hypothetical protein QHJ73_06595, partial [Armatimonadota bacterium]|nr:hypothetical protein [Armatimonadota bacterium]